ncbi:hypothetical protein OHA21_49050 [Actinoplanes sp. NBC_00393]|uniref:hypothetical protein n=1 Tax=Actinoplanes sp. NBC_00393 TaxID=2975953 RepID=UPI002E1DA5C6
MIDIRLLVMAVVTAASLTACGSGSVFGGGCSHRDRAFAGDLNELAILGVHPDGAEGVGEGFGCDEDDGFAHAGRSYRSRLDRPGVQTFYRTAAEQDGWTWSGDGPGVPSTGLVVSAARSCFTKEVDGTTAYLAVWFPSDFNDTPGVPDAPADEYGLEVTASHDGAAWC